MTTQAFPARVWSELSGINVNDHTDKKGNLTYLSWAWAWATLMSKFPASTYKVLPNVTYTDGSVETWVSVTVTEGEESLARDMWLPVMDNRNNAIVNPTARQISDTRMRCLVKCLALFGLGHYIYAGEDLPSEEKERFEESQRAAQNEAKEAFFSALYSHLENEDSSGVAEVWNELTDDEKSLYWRELNNHTRGKVRKHLEEARKAA